MARIAILGGTGPEGMGLALRLAGAGEAIIIGSRNVQRARQAAGDIRVRLQTIGRDVEIDGSDNAEAARRGELVALALPFEGLEPVLIATAESLRGKVVLDVVNPLILREGVFEVLPIAAGSAAATIQQLVPAALVVSGFKTNSATELADVEAPLHGDVLLCGDHPEATGRIAALVGRIPSLRPVDCGGSRNARHLESVTALLLNLNRRYRATTSVQILGLNV